MKFLLNLFYFILISACVPANAQKEINLISPDKNIVFSFRIGVSAPEYKIVYKRLRLVNYSSLQLNFADGGEFSRNLKMGNPVFKEGDETYELVVGKAKQVRNRYREVLIPLEEPTALKRKIKLVVRAYDDGIAFRYEFPLQDKWTSYTLTDELTQFNLNGNPTVRALFLPNYTSSHEGLYTTIPFNDIKEDTLMDMPALFEFANNNFMAITEAGLVDYAGMYLIKHHGILTCRLSPLPGEEPIKVKAIMPHRSPWPGDGEYANKNP